MTNAEYYLKDGVENIESLIQNYFHFIGCVEDSNRYNSIYQFFLNEAKPTLTEDEGVILKNIDKKYSIIYRDSLGRLEVKSVEIESTIWKISMVGFNHLFKFIKNGEEYSIEELLKEEN